MWLVFVISVGTLCNSFVHSLFFIFVIFYFKVILCSVWNFAASDFVLCPCCFCFCFAFKDKKKLCVTDMSLVG